jgi:hypothetical protein
LPVPRAVSATALIAVAVFIVATANDVSQLPPELLDQLATRVNLPAAVRSLHLSVVASIDITRLTAPSGSKVCSE